MARRRRLSIVIAQLGSGITRSPALPDLVDGSRSNPTLYGGSDANVHRRSRGQIDFVPTDGDTLPNPASGRQHHQRQIRQIPDLSRLAGLRYGKPLLTFLGAQRSGFAPGRALDACCLPHWVDRHGTMPGSQTHQTRDDNLRRTRSTDALALDRG